MHWLRNFIAVLFLLAPAFAFAQSLPPPIQYAVAPEAPGPDQNVVIQASGVNNFLGDADITWTQDGKVISQGLGVSYVRFKTGPLGSATTIKVSIDSPTQGLITQSWTFSPSLLNLVWEADTTVPPFYLGKALWSAGSPLRVVAFPTVFSGPARVAASALSYKWSVNGNLQTDSSGLGRYQLSFTGSELDNAEDVTVDAYYGAAQVAHGEVVIPATHPALVLYQRDPLRGVIYDTAFPSTISLIGKEITLEAQPFYFSRPDWAAGNLSYAWQLGGQDTTGPDAQSGILTLRQTGDGQGQTQVSVAVQDNNQNNFVQNASTILSILFGTQNSTSAFGI